MKERLLPLQCFPYFSRSKAVHCDFCRCLIELVFMLLPCLSSAGPFFNMLKFRRAPKLPAEFNFNFMLMAKVWCDSCQEQGIIVYWKCPDWLWGPVGNGYCFDGSRAGGMWRWPCISICCENWVWVELYFHCPICLNNWFISYVSVFLNIFSHYDWQSLFRIVMWCKIFVSRLDVIGKSIWKLVFLLCCHDLAEVCTSTQRNLLVCPVASEIVQGDGNRRYMITLDTAVDIMNCLKEVRKR
jgi:hypothetical protein